MKMKTIETKIAEQNVDASIAQFEHAVNHLIDKVESTAGAVNEAIDTAREKFDMAVERYETAKETVRRPIAAARDLGDRAAVLARDFSERVRRNPEPYISWSALAVGLFLCWRAVAMDRRARIKHSWSQLEP
jgi:hypothetical protein